MFWVKMISKFVWNAFYFCLCYILRLSKNASFFKIHFFWKPSIFSERHGRKNVPNNIAGCLWSLSNWLCLPISISGDLFHLVWCFVLCCFYGFDHGIHQHLEHPSFGRICLVLLSPQKSPSRDRTHVPDRTTEKNLSILSFCLATYGKGVRWVQVPLNFSRWWFQIFFIFTPTWGRWPNLTNVFQRGRNQHLDFWWIVPSIFDSQNLRFRGFQWSPPDTFRIWW